MKPTPLDVAKAAWGEPLPDWIEALAIACTETCLLYTSRCV